MMLYPPVPDLLRHTESRYLLVNVIAKRAREISVNANKHEIPLEQKPVSLAVQEIADGYIYGKSAPAKKKEIDVE